MLTVQGLRNQPFTADQTGASAVLLGDASKGTVSTWVVYVHLASGTLTALKFKGVISGSGLAVATHGIDLCYTNRTTGALVDGGTGITASGVYEVNGAGLDVYADIDVGAGPGTVSLYVEGVAG
jgi:hypothetical protein